MTFLEISELNANRVDPYQTPRSEASELGLHGSPVRFMDAMLKWVKGIEGVQEETLSQRIAYQ